MRNFFNKTSALFIFFISVSIVLTLGFSVIKTLTSDRNTDYRIGGGAIASIESETDIVLTNQQLKEFIKKLDYPITITVSGEKDELFVFCSDETTVSLDVNGRGFDPHELENSVKGALISESIEKQCYERDGKKYVLIDNLEYEVIGMYDSSSSKVKCYTSLLYKMEEKPNQQVNSFNLYGENREKCAKEFKSYISSIFSDGSVKAVVYVTEEQLIDDGSMFYVILILLIILLFLNLSTVIQLWLQSKNKEIFVRIMSGANSKSIFGRLIVNFTAVLVISFIIGGVISCGFIITGIGKPVITAIDLSGTLLGFLVFLMFGIVYASLLISNKIRKDLAEFKR